MDFRLLVKRPSDASHPSVQVEGEEWSLTDSLDIYSTQIPPYACVSYVWGSGRAPNPIHTTILMSDRTLPVLSSAIRNSKFEAFWIDAFCVPSDPVRKGPTLESMGFIYGRAAKVIAVLGQKSYAAVKQMSFLKRNDVPTVELMKDMEQEPWIRSVWTYQEVVNSSGTFFVGEDTTDGDLLDVSGLLNNLGYYLLKFREHLGITGFELRKRFPNLDTFEDLAADWQLAAFARRSALEIMSNMSRRSYEDPRNYFYSMIGALTETPSKRSKKPTIETLAETFMAIAEEKGDYSFIFSCAPRDQRPGLEWRPRPVLLKGLIEWHVDGEALDGVKEPNGIRLKNMALLHPATHVSTLARDAVLHWTGPHWINVAQLPEQPDTTIALKLHETLRELGFTGNAPHILAEEGIVFPQEEAPTGASVEIWVALDIYYPFGSPGIAIATIGNTRYYSPVLWFGSREALGDPKEVFIPTNIARL